MQLLEKAKKKYLSRIKRLEQQMDNMSDRNAVQVVNIQRYFRSSICVISVLFFQQVRLLKQKLLAFEDESLHPNRSTLSSAPSETSL